MKFVIDSDVLAKYNLSVEEYVILIYFYLGNTKLDNRITESLFEKGYLTKNINNTYIANNHQLDDILAMSAESLNCKIVRDRCTTLAKTLMEIFPLGNKPGTPYAWRSNKRDVTLKLNKFFKEYEDPKNPFTDEQIIEATKRYVESFNGNYTYMQLLKYFISKKDLVKGEEKSELASYIENAGQEETQQKAFYELV